MTLTLIPELETSGAFFLGGTRGDGFQLPLIPELETSGSGDQVADDMQQLDEIFQSTHEVSGGIVRERELVRGDEPETGWSSPDGGETSRVHKPRLAAPLIRLPAGTLPKKRVQVLQQWEGIVTAVAVDAFFADLQDVGDSSQPLEVVEIPIEEVPEDDRSLLVEGAVFYWSIGYETSPGGTLRRVSEIRMRRTPRWTKRAIQQVKKRAEELFELHGQ